MKKFWGIIAIIILGLQISPAFALYGNYDEFVQDVLPEQKPPLIIPKGSFFRGFIGQTVSSEYNNEGDLIKVLIPSDFIYENQVILPKNSFFVGQVANLEKAQQGRNGLFSINIIGLVLPDERKFYTKGYIAGAKNNKTFGGEFSKRSGHKTTLHRSTCFGRKGTLQLQQNGPRIMGKETRIKMGELVTVVIEEQINIEEREKDAQ